MLIGDDMLIIVLLLCLLTSIYVMFRRQDNLSLYFLGMCISNILMFIGIIVYISKMGGFSSDQIKYLFLFSSINKKLRYLPMSMNKLGYMVAIGRCLFPYFVMLASMETTMIGFLRRRDKKIKIVLLIPIVIMLIYYMPLVYRKVTSENIWLAIVMMKVNIGILFAYLFFSALLIFEELYKTTISYCKKNFTYVFMAILSIDALYGMYATKDPAQIYNFYISEYIEYGIPSYIGPGMTEVQILILFICTICFVFIGSFALVRYTKLDYEEGKSDLRLQKKYDIAGDYASVFVHGIKNQLLSSRVLIKRMNNVLNKEDINIEKVKNINVQLSDEIEGMLQRMDELRRMVKTNTITLIPVGIMDLIMLSGKKFNTKYPKYDIDIIKSSSRMVLADTALMAEAMSNLMSNAVEAELRLNRSVKVEVLVHEERLWSVIEIKDYGGGIPKDIYEKIFEPFYTNKNSNTNWGMGLYYVKKIINGHFGKLKIETKEGEGSSFFIMLPRFDMKN